MKTFLLPGPTHSKHAYIDEELGWMGYELSTADSYGRPFNAEP